MFRMASCGEVDHSVSSLPPSKKGSSSSGSNGAAGSGNSAESSCSGSSNISPAISVPECAICLQSCIHPVQLPCHHIFCFLCVKGASWQSKRCALCRQEVPDDFMERPTLLSPEELKASAGGRAGEVSDHAWYYEGRNGWWQYDVRTSRELEDAFSKGKKTAEMLIAGFLYVADLENMVQYRRNEHGRRRKMKRDVLDIPKKGVAGLRLDTEGITGGIGAAGRENSADGADTTAVGVQQQGAGISSAPPAPPPALRPQTSLAGRPGSSSPSLEEALSQLQVSHRPTQSCERSGEGEGEDEDEEVAASPSRSSDLQTSVDESGSGDWSDDEEEEDHAEEAQGEGDGEHVEVREGRSQRQRLNPEDRALPGAESTSHPSSTSERSRMPDGQCTVTEV
ncbi:E3 ubiquitin-protein ligase rnf146 [Syngnathoides biaculeatus]|uniref:E3 ubiquitin-protein ligase rnf146 n=1 Tax=Syngnathoides biaculeatus TaxID=300417 RepID=UPI002ADDDDA5|nr:E3 ubiquitin-protein ligase rnf146 [Syngnathoides biaculeatus]XP_061674969.1 E3 ubiquitin-protein ligase rnf146 [Syngnathoides biaculeatus]XP_061674970.1 E3 ubiquitin-protein ligase rnf146 [Syngnathoides biaculeatus]XP_061674971.1 E3 ubiquitin-protein ligase rnf146 [Syngnathoides biaculeatus]XP_061674972.1 E3 ubiquitin-protein ligase rnf146 [Syngnathoides biaculeatus]XP_061674973.1 E3 ubiquitin-protein ligase rnf146 [Syngnathoides biaculeatus]XP_061674974.1 E3 ubiquitin-protein ligase rnf1